MRRYHASRALRRLGLSVLEEVALLAGFLVILAAALGTLAAGDAGGPARMVGSGGLALLALAAASRALRAYRVGVRASLPTSVARVPVRTQPRRAFSALTALLALGLPLAAAVAAIVLVKAGWLLLAVIVLVGGATLFASRLGEAGEDECSWERSSTAASEILQRLCMRAGMRAPRLAVRSGPMATAWTAGGQIHVTRRLLTLLDDAELEAVLAHELAHLAHRDAVAMEICSAPSRVLLTFARSLTGRLGRWLRSPLVATPVASGFIGATAIVGALSIPPAFVVGWMARLSVLGISRAREFSADAAAVTLTGRPSALASALLKLDRQREWTPRSDLRQVEAYAMLCIVGTATSRLGRLLSTHPPTAARVRRLDAIEARIHRP